MPLVGDVKLLARLRRASRVGSAMDRWANQSAEVIAQEARNLLDEGGIPSPNHVVSAPGAPANTDSGNLRNHTNAEDLPDIGHAAVISDADYSRHVEYGTSRMAERPFLRPATSNKRKAILDAAKRAVDGVIKG